MRPLIRSVDCFTHQGFVAPGTLNHYSEDRFVAATRSFAVIDGATSLTAADMGGINPSAYTSRFLADFIMAHDQSDMTAREMLLAANRAFAQDLAANWPDIVALGKLGPCASAALLRLHDDGTATWANVSDCVIAQCATGDDWQVLSEWSARHAELDDQLADATFAEIAKGAAPAAARKLEHIQEICRANRSLVNVEYGVFNADPEMADFLFDGRIDLQAGQSFALFSDGMIWPEGAAQAALGDSARNIGKLGPAAYYAGLQALYDADPQFQRFRRLKHMDDATALLLRMGS